MDLNNYKMIRKFFGESDDKRDQGLTVPSEIRGFYDISYGKYGQDNLLDVYTINNVAKPQPAIISIHGGGWVYGDKDRYRYYCMDLALRGFTVVNFTYRLAPENKWPAALEDINAVFNWVKDNADKYFIDIDNVFVVGDSAGAQLASQYLAMFTNSEFAELYNFDIPKDKIKVRAAALNCGIYDIKKYIETGDIGAMAYFLGDDLKKVAPYMDTMKYINGNFPPSYIMTSYYDFLKGNAQPMYKQLKSLGVTTEYKMYGSESVKNIGHVFHLDIRSDEAKKCNDTECSFFRQLIK